jgi:hypothetical protein
MKPNQKLQKRVQTKPFTFQDWWDKEGHVFGVEAFKACRAAWNAAQAK